MKDKKEPLVSVIIPTYNRSDWLKEAINSVLEQTYKNYEILVIDDGSEEKISDLDILKNDKIRYFYNSNHGVAYSRNYGIKKAIGKYVAFLDSDDFWHRDKLKVQVSNLEETGAKWSQHNYYYYDDDQKKVTARINTYKYRDSYKYALFCSFKVQTSCFMADREAVISNNCYFDENKTFGEDVEFYLKMVKLYPLQCLNEYLGYFRIRGSNAGKDVKKQIISRAVFWNEHKLDQYVRNHMSQKTEYAYKWCTHINNEIILSCKFLSEVTYCIPWLIFKMESKRLEKRKI